MIGHALGAGASPPGGFVASQGPEVREAIVAAGSNVLAAMVHELEAAAMEIFGRYNAGVSRVGRAAAEKAEVA